MITVVAVLTVTYFLSLAGRQSLTYKSWHLWSIQRYDSTMIHTVFSGLFTVAFAVAIGLFAAGAALKSRQLLTWGSWGFLTSFGLLSILYFSGFGLKADLLTQAPALVARAVEKHHRVSKFVLTGGILISSACSVVLYRFRKENDYPIWFRANILFISLTLLVFVLRSLLTGFSIEWAQNKTRTTEPQAATSARP
jgi:hypothetical protein